MMQRILSDLEDEIDFDKTKKMCGFTQKAKK